MTITQSGRLASIWVVPQDIPVPLYFYTMGFFCCVFCRKLYSRGGHWPPALMKPFVSIYIFVYNMVVYLLVEEQLWCFYYHYSEIMALPLLAGVR